MTVDMTLDRELIRANVTTQVGQKPCLGIDLSDRVLESAEGFAFGLREPSGYTVSPGAGWALDTDYHRDPEPAAAALQAAA